MIFRQLFDLESSTYTYLLADAITGEAVVIDPVLEQNQRDSRLIKELGLKLLYILETHIHADHITGADLLRAETGAKTAVAKTSGVECADRYLEDGDEILFGSHRLRVIATPGHTNSCLSYYGEGRVFTGDAVLIRGCGRTDFQEGSSEKLFNSVRSKIFSLPEETLIFPAHDYKGVLHSSVREEKKFNPRLNESIGLDVFKGIMSALKLDPPKKIQVAVPANRRCGKTNPA